MKRAEPTPVLETARLRLRLLEEGDEALYCSLYANASVMVHIGDALCKADAIAAFARALACNRAPEFRYRCWVMKFGPFDVVGIAALNGDVQRAEMGAMVLPEWHGHGFGTEALAGIQAYAFDELSIAAVFTRHRPENRGAEGLMTKLDFQKEAVPRSDGMQYWVKHRVARQQ